MLVLTLGLSACEREGPAERAGEKVDKTLERAEDALQGSKHLTGVGEKAVISNHLSEPLLNTLCLSTTDYEKAKGAAPSWDIYYLEREWSDWIAKKGQPEKPGPAFIAFCRKKYQREGRP